MTISLLSPHLLLQRSISKFEWQSHRCFAFFLGSIEFAFRFYISSYSLLSSLGIERILWIDVCPENGSLVAAGGEGNSIYVYDRRESKVVKTFSSIHTSKKFFLSNLTVICRRYQMCEMGSKRRLPCECVCRSFGKNYWFRYWESDTQRKNAR